MNREEILKLSEQLTSELLVFSNVRSVAMISEATLEPQFIFTYMDETTEYFKLSDEKLEEKLLNIINAPYIRGEKLKRIVDET